jgi:peptidoglycan/xylan/chitin deacetylase (PgdA/CDA1 family)
MFHRVLPARQLDRLGADPLWTVTPELLRDCVVFFRRNYNLVALDDVLLSRRRTRALPERSLLITFDDGWRDNLDWAHPVLRDLPWTLFAVTDAVSEPKVWWQEVLLWALRSQRASYDQLKQTAHEYGASRSELGGVHESHLLILYGALPAQVRERALAPYQANFPHHDCASQMLSGDNLKHLQSERVSFGAHGASHLPLSEMSDPRSDLVRARDWLKRELGPSACRALSFPHGRWDSRAANAARELGYELLFTSDPILNQCPKGWLASDVIGRIPVRTHDVIDRRGRVAPERLAGWLYHRERNKPEGEKTFRLRNG